MNALPILAHYLAPSPDRGERSTAMGRWIALGIVYHDRTRRRLRFAPAGHVAHLADVERVALCGAVVGDGALDGATACRVCARVCQERVGGER